ncbi:MAG: hypothetical protein AAGC73_06185 [Verrucomicrobiota bacterium]
MKIAAAALLLASLGLSSISWAKPFSSILGEDAEMFLYVKRLSESRNALLDHPFYEMSEDEELHEFFELFSDSSDDLDTEEPGFVEVLKEDFGLTVDELFELFPGQGGFVFFSLTEMIMDEADYPDMAILLEYEGEREKLDELLQIQFERNAASQKAINPAIEHELKEESFMGETLYFDEVFDGVDTYVEDGYALVEGIFILASPEDRLRSIVESIKKGPDAALDENASYLNAVDASGTAADISLYLNLEKIMPVLSEAFVGGMMESGLATYGVTSSSLEKALSFNSLLSFYMDFELEEEGIRLHSNLIHSGKTGLLSLLSYKSGLLPEATYIPDDLLSASVSLFDMGAMLSSLESLLNTASPALAPMIDIQLQKIQTQTGVDFRSAILENLGTELVNFSMMEDASDDLIIPVAQQYYVLEIKDGDSLARAIETLKDLVPGGRAFIEAQEFEGQTIFTVQTPQVPNPHVDPELRFSYLITRSSLIMGYGKIGNLQKMLTDMNDSSAEGIFQDPEVEALFERIAQPNPVARSYADLSAFIEPMIAGFRQAGMIGGIGADLEIPDALSGGFRILTETNEDENGIYSRALLIINED